MGKIPDPSIEKCFHTLGIKKESSFEEVKQTYRDLVNVWHPDRFVDNKRLQDKATEKLKEINVAYRQIVSFHEEKRRSSADQYIVSRPPPEPAPESPPPPPPPPTDSEAQQKKGKWAWKRGVTLFILAVTSITLAGYIVFNMIKTTLVNRPIIIMPEQSELEPSEQGVDAMPVIKPPTHKKEQTGEEKPPGRKKASQSIDYFTLGSTRDEVLSAQGTPTRIWEENRWSYGFSYVEFEKGRVKKWYNSHLDPLKVKMIPSKEPSQSIDYFTLGSTRDEVLAVQGTPTRIWEHRWGYGFSYVEFEKGRVKKWYSSEHNPLKVKMIPSKEPSQSIDYFTLGSTRDEVLSAQGTPTRIWEENRWSYGFSYVEFEKGRVKKWYSSEHNPLRVELEE